MCGFDSHLRHQPVIGLIVSSILKGDVQALGVLKQIAKDVARRVHAGEAMKKDC